jgi:polysaccharide biosynthesis transport protein
MTLRELVGSFRKHVLIIIMTVIAATGAAGVLSYVADPVYRSSSSLHFSLDFGRSASDLNQGQAYTQSQMLTFAQLATLPVVLDPVIEELGLPTTAQALGSSVTASRPQDATILEISATGGSPEQTALVANAVALQLAEVAEDFAPRDEAGRSTVRVRVVK